MAKMLERLVAVATLVPLVTPPFAAYAQVVPDPHAPAGARPLIESTANGLPLVQITAPSAAGVSRNQYQQFNVDRQGLILNNAATITNTRQAGYVDGNPFLGGGAARLILNEVTGGDLSRLRGFTEVAGQRAEVVIANPNGISCDGCGFINASRGVLSTGTPVFDAAGALAALNVTRGLITVEGQGLHGGDADRVDLISRALAVNAAVWANQLNVVAGAGRTDYASLATQRVAGEGAPPEVAIDVAALGGMYANRIRLIGTEAGVGVNSRGTIAALQGDFTVTAEGKVILGGTTSAAGAVAVTAGQGFANSGSLYGQAGVAVASSGLVDNSGSLASGGTAELRGTQVRQTGIAAAGIDASGRLGATGDLALHAGDELVATGTSAAPGALSMQAAAIDARGAQVVADSVSLSAVANDIDASGATLEAERTLAIAAAGDLRHDGATTVAGQVAVEASTLSNRGGYLGQSGAGATAIAVAGLLDNADGVVTTDGADVAIRAGEISNARGRIEHAGTGVLAVSAARAVDNESGVIASNGSVQLQAARLANAGGAIHAVGDASVAVAGEIANAGGALQSGGVLAVTAGTAIDNRGGVVESGGGTHLRAGALDNRSGTLTTVGVAAMSVDVAGAFDNSAGVLGGNGAVDVAAGGVANRSGAILAGEALSLQSADGLDNAGGRVAAGAHLSLTQNGALANEGGTIEAAGSLRLAAGALSNARGAIVAAEDASLAAGGVVNERGLIAAGRDASLSSASLAGKGSVAAGRDVAISIAGDYTHGSGSAFETGRDLALDVTGTLVNEGELLAPRRLRAGANALANETGSVIAGAETNVGVAGSLTNRGRIEGDDVTVSAGALANRASVVGDRVTVTAGDLSNEGAAALIGATANLALHVPGRLTNRDGASLYSLGDMTISGGPERGADGRYTTATTLLLNESAFIEADGTLEIAANDLVNRRGSLVIGTETIGSTAQWYVVYPGWQVIQEGYDNENGLTFYSTNFLRTPVTAAVLADAVIEHDEPNRRLTFNGTGQEVVTEYICQGSSDGDFCGDRSRIADVPKTVTVYYENLSRAGDAYHVVFYPEYDPNVHIHPTELFAVFINGRGHSETRRLVQEVVTEERVVSAGAEARIAAGGDMALDVRAGLRNEFGLVAAGGSLAVAADKVANVGRDLLRSSTVNRTSIVEWHDSCGLGERDCGDSVVPWPFPPQVTTSVAGTVRGVVAANQSLSITARSVENVSVLPAGAPVGGIGSTTVAPTPTAIPGARTVDPLASEFALPTGGLFRVAPPNPSYLIETDPRFADYRTFLSSEYMLSRLALDPGTTAKRLGDGFYEARLVREEIYRLTGRRYLAAYSSDTEQFRALMENGIAFAAALSLSPGIALSPEQMVALTHDIVWLEEREVALPDGRSERVLVPVVYLAAADAEDLQPSGALIAANDLVLRTTDAVTNTGVIRGGDRAALGAGTVQNIGGTIASRGVTQVEAVSDIVNRSGVIRGVDVSVLAGRDVHGETVLHEVTAGSTAIGASSTLRSQRGSIQAERDATVAAGRDVTLAGAEVRAGGNASLGAAGSVVLDTVEAREARQLYMGRSHSVSETTTQIGASVVAGGDAAIGAGGDVTLRAAAVEAGRDLVLEAGGDLAVGAARDARRYDAESRGRKGTYDIRQTYDETVVGSSLVAGGTVSLAAGTAGAAATPGVAPAGGGAITVTGSSIGSGSGAIALAAPGGITIQAESERHTSFSDSRSKKSGLLSKKTVEERHSSDLTLARSSTVSGQSIDIASGASVTVRGSSVVATDDVTIAAAKDVTITAAEQTLATENYRYEKKSGAFGSGGFGLTIGQQTIKSLETEDSLTNLGSTVGSVQGRAGIVAGEEYRQTGSEVLAPAGVDIAARNVTIDAAQDASRYTYSYERKQSGVSVALTGAVVSPLVTAKDSLERGGDVEDSRLKAVYAYRAGRSVYEAGEQALAAAAGKQPYLQVQVSVGSSEQKLDSRTDSTRAVGSTVSSAGDVSIAAVGGAAGGGDLAVAGSTVSGANVALSAARELSLRSAANTSATETVESGKSGAVGMSVGVGPGFGFGPGGAGITAFASASKSSGNTTANSTTWTETQITAGETLALASGGDASLVGAQARGECIEAVVGGSLTLQSQQDIDTYDRDIKQSGGFIGYTLGSGSFNGSASSYRGTTDSDFASVQEQTGLLAGAGGFDVDVRGNTDLRGAVIASEAAPERNRLATGTLTFSDIANRAEYESSASGGAIGLGGTSLPIPTPVLGVSGGEEAASTTLAAVAPGRLEIRNPGAQQQDVSGLSRTPDTSHQALARLFDPQSVEEQQELAQVFGQEAFRAVGDIASIFTRPYEQAKADEAIARAYLALKAKEDLTEAERRRLAVYEQAWSLTPERAQLLAEDALRRQALSQADYDAWKEGSLNKTLLHGFVGALQASFGGADALSGALGAGAAEASRNLTEQLPRELQQWASAAVGAAAGAMAGNGSAGLQTGAATAWSGEVYNRQLHPKESAWIAQNARAFAKDQGISEEEAKTRLALQAAKDVDFLWRGGLAPGDDEAARAFLAKADETFINERGNPQRLFTTELGQYFAFQQGLFDADRSFYRSYLTPNVTRDIATGAREEAQRLGIGAWNAVRSDPLGVAGALASGLYEAGVAMVLDPQGAMIGAYDRFMASGQDIGTGYGAVLDPALRDPLNALYGQDVSGAVAIATTANAAATVGAVFGAGKVAGVAGEAALSATKLASAAVAKRVNEAILAMGKGPVRQQIAESLLATNADEAVFWSGIGRGGDLKAANWAAQHGGLTLETTMAARGVRVPNWDPNDAATIAAWKQTSISFAAGARGNVRVLQSDFVRIDAIWVDEFKALKANPNVHSIRAINPDSGAEVLLWSR